MNTIKQIGDWFKVAVPNPDDKARNVQLGVHLEEVAEMLASTKFFISRSGSGSAWRSAAQDGVERLSQCLKCGEVGSEVEDREEFADSLADQIVTAIGLAHMHGIDIVGALGEVSRSNWSKFEDGKPVFDENGKIKKGRDYRKPDLSSFV